MATDGLIGMNSIQMRARKLGLDCLTPIMWHKISNGTSEAEGNGTGFYGTPYQHDGVIKDDIEYILFLCKGGKYRSPAGSLLFEVRSTSSCDDAGVGGADHLSDPGVPAVQSWVRDLVPANAAPPPNQPVRAPKPD